MNRKLIVYLKHRFAAEIADGFMIATARNGQPVLARPAKGDRPHQILEFDLPAHLRPVADAEQWHREHTARAPTGLPLFAQREDPTAQGSLF